MAGATKEPVKGTYQHYKGALYEVLGIAEDPESGNRFVVYLAIGVTENVLGDDPGEPMRFENRIIKNGAKGELAVCTVKRFTEEVDGKEYHGGRRVPRFRLVSPAPRG